MGIVRTDSQYYSGIAAAIRSKRNTAATYTPGQMAAAIGGIETPALESLSASRNGTYTPSSGKNGFSEVTVAVPPPTLAAKTVTQNGSYDPADDGADGYSAVTVNVSGDPVYVKNVRFNQSGLSVSADGRVVSSFSVSSYLIPYVGGAQVDVNWTRSFRIGTAFRRDNLSAGNSVLFGSDTGEFSSCPAAGVNKDSNNAYYLGLGIGTSSASQFAQWINAGPLTAQKWYYFEVAYDETTQLLSWKLTDDFSTYTGSSASLGASPYYSSLRRIVFGTLSMQSVHTNADLKIDLANCFLESRGTRLWGFYTGAFPAA